MAYKSKVYAEVIDYSPSSPAMVMSQHTICLGTIEFSDLAEGFVKTIRMYNKNARKHICYPQFEFNGYTHLCDRNDRPSKTGKGTTDIWYADKLLKKVKMPITWYGLFDATGHPMIKVGDALVIPVRKVNDLNAISYVEKRDA